MEEYYKELKVPHGASLDEITQSYRRLIAQYHPDRHPGPASEELTKRVNLAYSKLQEYFESNPVPAPEEIHKEEPEEIHKEPDNRYAYTSEELDDLVKQSREKDIQDMTLGFVFLVFASLIIFGFLYGIYRWIF